MCVWGGGEGALRQGRRRRKRESGRETEERVSIRVVVVMVVIVTQPDRLSTRARESSA